MQGVGKLGSWVAVLAALSFAACHEPPKLHRVQAMAAFDPVVVDFGQVPVGTWRAQQVRVKNIGYVPFGVEAIQADGDPSYHFELDGNRVGRGEERNVTVRFHPLLEGPIAETLTVTTDADLDPVHRLAIRGEGVPAGVVIEPAQLDFATLELDSERTLDVVVDNPSDLPLMLSVTGDGDWQFSTDLQEIPPLATTRMEVRYHPGITGQVTTRLEARPCPSCTPGTAQLIGAAVPSAFSFVPSPVSFEPVPVHAGTHSTTRATNVTWRAVELLGISTDDPSFTPSGPLPGWAVGPGDTFEMGIDFSARHDGPTLAQLKVAYRSDRERSSEVTLEAGAGLPQLALAPASIDFGTLPVGGKAERVVRLSNAGTSGNLSFKGVRATGEVESFAVAEPSRGAVTYPWQPGFVWPNLVSPGVAIAPGADWLDVRVFFQPARRAELFAQLVFESDDRFHPERTVELSGRSYEVGPCVFRVLPAGVLDFGNVPAGSGAVLGFRFENAGLNQCAVKDIHLSSTGAGAFFMPGGALAGGVVMKDDSFAAQIAFKAKAPGRYQGELSITVNNPVNPVFHLPVRAVASESCLVAVPNYLDFGPIRYDCTPESRTTLVSNQCPNPLMVTGVEVGPGTSDQFSALAPPAPLALEMGQGFEVKASYSRTVHGQHYSPLWIRALGEAAPFLVPMLAETNHENIQVETFVQGVDNQLDLLFVLSNTTTMSGYQERLAAAMPGWIAEAVRKGVDLRVGVTTTGLVPKDPTCPGGAQGGEAGRLFPVDGSAPRVVSSTWPNAANLLQQQVKTGTCHNLVQGLETMRAALSAPLIGTADDPRTPLPSDGNLGLLRPTARLTVVFLADEDDHSGFDPASYVQFLRTLKGPGMAHRTQAQAIVPLDASCLTAGPPGPRFVRVADGTGGETLSVCSPSYQALLERLTTRAAGPQADFPLSALPSGVSEMTVTVDGISAAPGTWRYDAPSQSLIFESAAIPRAGQTIEVRYRAACPPPL